MCLSSPLLCPSASVQFDSIPFNSQLTRLVQRQNDNHKILYSGIILSSRLLNIQYNIDADLPINNSTSQQQHLHYHEYTDFLLLTNCIDSSVDPTSIQLQHSIPINIDKPFDEGNVDDYMNLAIQEYQDEHGSVSHSMHSVSAVSVVSSLSHSSQHTQIPIPHHNDNNIQQQDIHNTQMDTTTTAPALSLSLPPSTSVDFVLPHSIVTESSSLPLSSKNSPHNNNCNETNLGKNDQILMENDAFKVCTVISPSISRTARSTSPSSNPLIAYNYCKDKNNTEKQEKEIQHIPTIQATPALPPIPHPSSLSFSSFMSLPLISPPLHDSLYVHEIDGEKER